ncbi:hypothetical protein Pint_36062 [Pistacia integerrima]|uniref:Uncharacterized protein n=1 Tax=Pistacia integerrima TaxID=434235 RepID=A0ACC0Y2V6_9ROSI|nr:hypothetical protein Pint_36062 [Pistacia integerrima]
MRSNSTTVDVPESSVVAKGKVPLIPAPTTEKSPNKKGLAIFDFLLKKCAIVTTLVAAAAMGTSDIKLFISSLSSLSFKLVMMIFPLLLEFVRSDG